ncbi:hypothetical protein ACFLU3_00090 [Chloroflexota bacterium]
MTRQEDILCDFIENEDRIWPPGLAPIAFVNALKEVLTRLPDDAYDAVCETVSFVVEDPKITATNVPFNRTYPSLPDGITIQFNTIVIFHQALAYPGAALVGLLAHELAHSFVDEQNYNADEDAADALVVRWGFAKEIAALRAEQQKAKQE